MDKKDRRTGTGAVPTYNRKAFISIARDRGYMSDISLCYHMGKLLGCSQSTAQNMIRQGAFGVSAILAISAWLEMTPKEFCDTWLHGYFQEDAQGHFHAIYEDAEYFVKRRNRYREQSQIVQYWEPRYQDETK